MTNLDITNCSPENHDQQINFNVLKNKVNKALLIGLLATSLANCDGKFSEKKIKYENGEATTRIETINYEGYDESKILDYNLKLSIPGDTTYIMKITGDYKDVISGKDLNDVLEKTYDIWEDDETLTNETRTNIHEVIQKLGNVLIESKKLGENAKVEVSK